MGFVAWKEKGEKNVYGKGREEKKKEKKKNIRKMKATDD